MQPHDSSEELPGKILDHGAGLGEADNDLVDQRAKELAEIAGLPAEEAGNFRQQARLELSGRADPDAANDDDGAVADLIEADDIPGESGGAVLPATNAASYGDEETIGEALYSEGVDEADHDRMTESRKEERRRES